ncbi:LysR substrate-binding domain-containing protein [Nocardia abscessus]|uniref:LysR substrate-binding domain-containing protein n=1 Tax=Nocardia abscessus TaxID=120957 RepID=UPI001E4E971C|nr:LysR substrate-binding domain-containing protein [Nocardia abscessus]
MDYVPTSMRSGGAAISVVHAGLGVTVQPECLVGHEWTGRVAALDLAEPWAERRIHLATARGREFSPATKVLIEQLLTRPIDENELAQDR